VATAVVDERGVGEASRGRRRGRAWCGRGRRGLARHRRRRRGRAWRRRDRRGGGGGGRRGRPRRRGGRRGRTWRGNRREPRRRGHTYRIGLEEGVEVGGWGGASKEKHILVEDDVTRDDDAVGGEVQTPIPLVVRGIAKEEAAGGARRKLMRGSSGSVRVAGTAEHAKVVVGGGCAV
jgi:hypothetical protein